MNEHGKWLVGGNAFLDALIILLMCRVGYVHVCAWLKVFMSFP